MTAEAVAAWRAGRLAPDPAAPPARSIPSPGRPAALRLVDARSLPRRRLSAAEGRAALLHAIAHIEFNAIDLAWDAVYRFRTLPREFIDDWVAVAADEARHFGLIERRLADYGVRYGDLPAHDGLWAMAHATADDPLRRMALVPRVLEARGLDVTPEMIVRMRAAGDLPSAAALEVILAEEVAHVAAGSRWFRYLCAERGVQPEATFRALFEAHCPQRRGAINRDARLAAGFSPAELDWLDAGA